MKRKQLNKNLKELLVIVEEAKNLNTRKSEIITKIKEALKQAKPIRASRKPLEDYGTWED